MTLHLHVRRFTCRLPTCPRAIFSEPLPEVVAPLALTSARPGDDYFVSTSLPLPDLRRARDPYRKRVQAQRHAQRLARYEQVLALYQAGASA